MIKIDSEIQFLKPIKYDLKGTLKKLSGNMFDRTLDKKPNPMMKGISTWKIVSDQLEDILGKEIHRQWFSQIRPLVISDKMLILQTPNRSSALWINTHYQNLVDLLLSFQDKELSSFFMCPSDIAAGSSENYENTNCPNH